MLSYFIIGTTFILSSTLVSALDYQPPFLTPTKGVVWKAGDDYSCSWNQTFPEGIFRDQVAQNAKFLLRYKNPDNSSDVSDYGNWTLANNIPLYPPYPDNLNFTLPSELAYQSTYFLILLGSTSDESQQFTILPQENIIRPSPIGPERDPLPSGSETGRPVIISSSMTSTAMESIRTSNRNGTKVEGGGGHGNGTEVGGKGKGRGKGKGKGRGKGKGKGMRMGLGGKGRKGMEGKGRKGKGEDEENEE